jgi:hypothetical protein
MLCIRKDPLAAYNLLITISWPSKSPGLTEEVTSAARQDAVLFSEEFAHRLICKHWVTQPRSGF